MIKKIDKNKYWESATGWSQMIEQKINEIITHINKSENNSNKCTCWRCQGLKEDPYKE